MGNGCQLCGPAWLCSSKTPVEYIIVVQIEWVVKSVSMTNSACAQRKWHTQGLRKQTKQVQSQTIRLIDTIC